MHAQAATDVLAMTDVPGSKALPAGQLVRRATGGDLDAFEELIRRLQRRVYGFAFHHLRDVDEAHDLTQEIFVKLYRNLGRYDSERPFEPWFWKLAANTTINYRRKRVPMPAEQSDEVADSETMSPGHDPPWCRRWLSSTRRTGCRSSFTTKPTSRSSRSAFRVDIMRLLSGLNAEQRRTIVLITHEQDIARFARRVVELRDGRVVRDEKGAA
jgi:RNA polymerase sigma factor (sigma-70 family)